MLVWAKTRVVACPVLHISGEPPDDKVQQRGPAARTSNHGTPLCRPRLLLRLVRRG